MYQYEKLRNLHKQKKIAIGTALEQCHCNKGEHFLASLIDSLIMFGVMIAIPIFGLKDGFESQRFLIYVLMILGVFIYVAFLIFLLNGQGIGYRLLGIRNVNVKTFSLYGKADILANIGNNVVDDFIYSDEYESLSYLFSETNQSVIDKRRGKLPVKYKLFKMFLEDYGNEYGQIDIFEYLPKKDKKKAEN